MNTSGKTDRPFDFDVSRYRSLPQLKGVLVTATDTEVGKTIISGAIALSLRAAGKTVEVFKPVATGCRKDREGLISEDGEFLAACADSRRMLSEIVPIRYRKAVSPTLAAELERRPVDVPAILDEYARLEGKSDAVVVEGIGGLLCPITDKFWVIHFARLTGLPLVIVARAGLGTINHTLMTIHAARSAGLQIAGVIVNRYSADPALMNAPPGAVQSKDDADLSMASNPSQIATLGGVKVLTIVPDDDKNSIPKLRIGEDTLFAMSQVDWRQVAGLE